MKIALHSNCEHKIDGACELRFVDVPEPPPPVYLTAGPHPQHAKAIVLTQHPLKRWREDGREWLVYALDAQPTP